LRDSMDHATDDMQARSLREQQVEADRVIEALDAAMAEDGDTLLETEEREAILIARQQLLEMRQNSEDNQQIRQAVEAVEKASAGYVAKRMNASVQKTMAGHKVEEFTVEDEKT
ncbi:MAG: Fe-S protein assembly chaperone HscA, partial [Gammaproteobacteria bacterium]|nr:Fe-S protein assembly chaperone HscA [Gammaproteobacteria bacterium]